MPSMSTLPTVHKAKPGAEPGLLVYVWSSQHPGTAQSKALLGK